MIDVRHEYMGMLAAAAGKKYAKKEAALSGTIGVLGALDLAGRGTGAGIGALKSVAKAGAAYAVPLAAMYLFSKYLAIPAFAGYAMGHSLATSASPSKADIEAAENNALAKETMRRTKALEGMPSVTPQARNKDMMTRRSMFDAEEAY
jgi:hypothetical protein